VGQNSSAANSSVLSLKGTGIWIENIHFADNDTSTKFTAVSTSTSKNVTISNCNGNTELEDFLYVGKYSSGTTITHTSDVNGQNAYFVYSALGSKYLDINNCYADHSRKEHGIRIH